MCVKGLVCAWQLSLLNALILGHADLELHGETTWP